MFSNFLDSAMGSYQTRKASPDEIERFRSSLSGVFVCTDARGFAHGIPMDSGRSHESSKERRRLSPHKLPPVSMSQLGDEKLLGTSAVLWNATSKIMLPHKKMFESKIDPADNFRKPVRLQCGCHVSARTCIQIICICVNCAALFTRRKNSRRSQRT